MLDLRLGDCIDGMSQLPPLCADLILTDPPYGIDFETNRRVVTKLHTKHGIANDGDDNTPMLAEAAREAYRILRDNRHLYWFTRWDRLEYQLPVLRAAGFQPVNCIIWDKGNHGMGDLEGAFAPQYECIVFCQKGRRPLFAVNGVQRHSDILRYPTLPRLQLKHSHQKPVDLIGFLVRKSTQPGELVVDPFMGSGTTAEACQKLGRDFIGWDIDPACLQMAEERTAQVQLFA